jgi:hypothetical protein
MKNPVSMRKENAPGEIRTHGPRIRNPVLYPTELRGHKYQIIPINSLYTKNQAPYSGAFTLLLLNF